MRKDQIEERNLCELGPVFEMRPSMISAQFLT
jgi:hypothetical protein